MSIDANRNSLKKLSELSIDSQYVHQLGLQVFNQSGQASPAYKNICEKFIEACDEMDSHIKALKAFAQM